MVNLMWPQWQLPLYSFGSEDGSMIGRLLALRARKRKRDWRKLGWKSAFGIQDISDASFIYVLERKERANVRRADRPVYASCT